MKIKIEVFGRMMTFDWKFSLKLAYKHLNILKETIKEPQILDNGLIDQFTSVNGEFYYHNYETTVSESDIIEWALNEIGCNGSILENSIEDAEWTAQRNKELTDIFYRKITFSKAIQDTIISEANRIQEAITKAITMWEQSEKAEQEKETAEKTALLDGVEWDIKEVAIADEGGKTYKYIHTITINGNIYTIIERNVFDFGRVYNSPEGGIYMRQNDKWVINRDNLIMALHEDHRRAITIVHKYGKFAGSCVRM